MPVTDQTRVLPRATAAQQFPAGKKIASERTLAAFKAGICTHADRVLMLGGFVLCLVLSFLLGHKRIFWEDEMLGWMLLRDPSFHHMVQAWNLGADGGGFTFYLLGRGWLKMFGVSTTAFRMFSATCFGLGFCITWAATRRFYPIRVVAVLLFTFWFVSPAFAIHMGEGRFYGLLVLGTALLVWLVMTQSQADAVGTVRTPIWLYPLMFVLHGLLTTSHLLGVMYSAALLSALIYLDWRAGRFRPWLYASGALSWLLLIAERHAIHASTAVGKPWFWTVPPDLMLFIGAFCGFSVGLALVLVGLFFLFRMSSQRLGESMRDALRQGYRERTPVYVVVAALLTIPVLFAVQAYVGGASLFTPRYLAPVIIAPALMAMELAQLTRWNVVLVGRLGMFAPPRRRRAVAALFAVCLLIWVFHLRRDGLGTPDYTTKLSIRVPRGLPVVCEDAWTFIDLISRQHSSGIAYTYLLDWAYSTSEDAPKLEVTQYHLMENWRKVGYFSGSVRDREEFLRTYNVFVVLNPKDFPRDQNGRVIGNPLLTRFALTPGYQVSNLSRGKNTKKKDYGLDQGYDVWLVCRGVCPQVVAPTGG